MSRIETRSASPTSVPTTPGPAVEQVLFDLPGASVFAVIDGASVPDLLPKLQEYGPEHVCLYRGELDPDLAECAPYLVRVTQGSPFLEWLLAGWGKHSGVFAVAYADLRTLRKHFRTFLMVNGPDGKPLYFRYYDPRVLRIFLPHCNPQEKATMFGPVQAYVMESDNPAVALRCRPASKTPESLKLRFAPVPAAAPMGR